jgi:hypothetical protein
VSDGKLTYEIEFAAKGLDEVRAEAERMKAAPMGDGKPLADLREQMQQAAAKARELAAARAEMVGNGQDTQKIHDLGEALLKLPGPIGEAARGMARLGPSAGLLGSGASAAILGLGGIAAAAIGTALAIDGAARAAASFQAEMDQIARGRQSSYEDFNKSLPRLQTREDYSEALSAQTRKVEEQRAKVEAMEREAGRITPGAGWGILKDSVSRGVGTGEWSLESDDMKRLQQERANLAELERQRDEIRKRGKGLGADEDSLGKLRAARESMATGDIMRGDDDSAKLDLLRGQLEKATAAYDGLDAAAQKAAQSRSREAAAATAAVERQAGEINRLKDQIAATERQMAAEQESVRRRKEQDEERQRKEQEAARRAQEKAEQDEARRVFALSRPETNDLVRHGTMRHLGYIPPKETDPQATHNTWLQNAITRIEALIRSGARNLGFPGD